MSFDDFYHPPGIRHSKLAPKSWQLCCSAPRWQRPGLKYSQSSRRRDSFLQAAPYLHWPKASGKPTLQISKTKCHQCHLEGSHKIPSFRWFSTWCTCQDISCSPCFNEFWLCQPASSSPWLAERVGPWSPVVWKLWSVPKLSLTWNNPPWK